MEQLGRFLAFVSDDYSGDYWSDVAIVDAMSQAAQLSADEWRKLQGSWRSLNPTVQERVAQLADNCEHGKSHASEMLIEMLHADSSDVIEASIDSLNSITQRSLDDVNIDELRHALTLIVPPRGIVAYIFERLKTRIA